MVAASSPRLDYVPTQCLARPMLFGALDAYERGDFIAAGCKLREAVLRFVTSAAAWYSVELPKRIKFPRPCDFITALHKAGHMDRWAREILLEAIDVGNQAAHCQKVNPNMIRGGIALVFGLMDSESYVDFVRVPAVTSYKGECDCCDDDDDEGEGWKVGAR